MTTNPETKFNEWLMMNVGSREAEEAMALVGDMLRAQRNECARIVELHENYVRDYSREVFAGRIAEQIREGRPPSKREVAFAKSVGKE